MRFDFLRILSVDYFSKNNNAWREVCMITFFFTVLEEEKKTVFKSLSYKTSVVSFGSKKKRSKPLCPKLLS